MLMIIALDEKFTGRLAAGMELLKAAFYLLSGGYGCVSASWQDEEQRDMLTQLSAVITADCKDEKKP